MGAAGRPRTGWAPVGGGSTGLDGVGQGFVLAGRYRLEERLQADSTGSQWRAVDQTLERRVVIRVLDAGQPQSEDIVDAARRAALAEDPRLVRILDVGSQPVPSGHATYIVSEHVNGRPLADAVASGPLPAETARRIVGEASQALARAASRGLHHLRLDPDTVWITSDGSVKLSGTAIDASIAGADPETSQAAEQIDARGLVAVLYAALTGRWPGAGRTRLAPAPRVHDRPASPADLVTAVPSDLDALCTASLAGDGPRSPAELADALAPWARSTHLTDPRGLSLSGPNRPAPRPVQHPPVRPAGRPATPPAAPARAAARREAAQPSAAPAAVVTPPSVPPAEAERAGDPLDRPLDRTEHVSEHVAAPAGRTGRRDRDAAPVDAPGHGRHSGSTEQLATGNGAQRPTDRAGAGAGSTGESPVFDAPFGAVGTATGSGPWAGFGHADDGEEYLGPFLPPAPLTRPPRDQSRLVLAIVAGVVAVGLVVALWSLRDFGGGTGDPVTTPAPSAAPRSATPSVSSAAPTASASTASATPSTAPPAIAGVRALDPLGDDEENDALATRAVDGDRGTAWRSQQYKSQLFGGLKDGLGLAVQLEDRVPVRQVTVTSRGSDGILELRIADGPEFEGSTVVATAPIEDGKAVLTPAQPVASRHLILWATRLPEVDGQGQLFVSEIEVR